MGGAFLLSLVMPWWQCGGPVSVRAPIRVQDIEAMNRVHARSSRRTQLHQHHTGAGSQSKCTSPTENRGGSTSTPAARFPPADHWILRESERSGCDQIQRADRTENS
jgi:hypothetical protein